MEIEFNINGLESTLKEKFKECLAIIHKMEKLNINGAEQKRYYKRLSFALSMKCSRTYWLSQRLHENAKKEFKEF